MQDFNTIRNQCLSTGALFEDPEFPACDESLMFSRRPDRNIEWLRPMVRIGMEKFIKNYILLLFLFLN